MDDDHIRLLLIFISCVIVFVVLTVLLISKRRRKFEEKYQKVFQGMKKEEVFDILGDNFTAKPVPGNNYEKLVWCYRYGIFEKLFAKRKLFSIIVIFRDEKVEDSILRKI